MNLRKLDLNLLLCFDALVAERHVSRAAERAGISQPAMSAALARLRKVFGDPLFLRGAHGMVPTARCAELAGPVRGILAQIDEVLATPPPFEPALSEATLTLVATDYVQLVVVPPLLGRLRSVAPGIRLRVLPANPRRLLQALELGEADLAIGHLPQPPPTLRCRELFDDDFVLLSARGARPLAQGVDLEAFCDLPHLVVNPAGGGFFGAMVESRLAAAGHERRIVLSVPHFLVAPAIVAATDLVAVVPRRAASACAGDARLQACELPLAVPAFAISMFWHEKSQRDDLHGWIRALIAELFAAA